MNFNFGQEAIAFQGPTAPFAVDMISYFQEILDYKKEVLEKEQGDLIKCAKAVRKFAKSFDMEQKFIKMVKKYTNLNLTIRFFTGQPSFIFAIGMDMTDPFKNSFGGTEYIRISDHYPDKEELVKDMERVKKSLDRTSGTITDIKGASKVLSTSAKLYWCIDTAYLLDLYHEKAVCLTADELAAIAMHEIHHVISAIDYAGFLYRSLEEFTAPVLINTPTIKEVEKNKNKLAGLISSYEKENGETNKSKVAKRAVLKIEELLEDKPNLNLFSSAICTAMTALHLALTLPIVVEAGVFMWLEVAFDDLFKIIDFEKQPKSKDSDFKHDRIEITDLEFRADAAVTAYGLGQELITGLDKMTLMSKLLKGSPIKKNKARSMIPYQLTHIMSILMSPYNSILESHGTTITRYNNIKNQLLMQMKASDLPAPLMEDLIIQYKNIEIASKARKSHSIRKGMWYEVYGDISKFIMTGGGLIHWFINGKADIHYNKLMELTTHLKNNELIYQKRRLEYGVK